MLTSSTRADEAHHIIKKGFALTHFELRKHRKGGRVLLIYIMRVAVLFEFQLRLSSAVLRRVDLLMKLIDSPKRRKTLMAKKLIMKPITRFSGAHLRSGIPRKTNWFGK